ncbi:hypothetical protein Pmani_036813 [Petrolisthes manimaculis]|uniref:Uncharacterized protein n=1 Tax=Petrolisthes manimaculis TaxID=1843537 RepID=A0AAE1TP02_9EUCA|nr:hypothetical protein Pmani_036813 [Petrolisthes manimaculis]
MQDVRNWTRSLISPWNWGKNRVLHETAVTTKRNATYERGSAPLRTRVSGSITACSLRLGSGGRVPHDQWQPRRRNQTFR